MAEIEQNCSCTIPKPYKPGSKLCAPVMPIGWCQDCGNKIEDKLLEDESTISANREEEG